MAVEDADDLAGFFNPDEFGRQYRAHLADGTAIDFNAIPTSTRTAERPGTSFDASVTVRSLVAARASVEGLDTDDEIDMPDGCRVRVNDIAYKGDVVVISYHVEY